MGSYRLHSVILILLLTFLPQPAAAQDSRENADFKLAVNLYNDGLYELAAEQFRQFIGSYPNTIQGTEARYYLGLSQMELGRLGDARVTFQTFALSYQNNPKAPEAWRLVGDIYAREQNHRESALAYERVKVFHPRSPIAPASLVEAGRQFQRAGLPDDARRVLRIALQEYPSSDAANEARTALAELYYVEGNTVQAQNELLRVIDGDPSPQARAQALLILGDIYRAQWRFDDSKVRYQEVIAGDPKSATAATARVHLGTLLNNAGDFREAAKNFQEASSGGVLPDSALRFEGGIGLGTAYEGMRDYQSAVHQFEKLLPGVTGEARTEVLWRIASAAGNAGDLRKAHANGSLILGSQPSGEMRRRTIILLAESSARGKEYSEAVRMYSLFLESFPGDPASPAVLLRAARISKDHLRDPRRAALYCETVISRFPESPEAVQAHVLGAGIYRDLGDTDRAIELWNALMTRYPASRWSATAGNEVRGLVTFEAKDKDAALERLALLLGDVVADHEKRDLAFKLGETYFNDLKNYKAAAAQFTNVINSGSSDPRFEQALLYRARSYEYLSWRDPSFKDQAVSSYRTFLETYRIHPERDAAAFSFFEIQATSVAAAERAFKETEVLHPEASRRADMLVRIGILQQESDSLVDALNTFTDVRREYPSSEAAGEASYRHFSILLAAGQEDLAAAEGDRYLSGYPNGAHSAEVLGAMGNIALRGGNAAKGVEYLSALTTRYGYTEVAANGRTGLAHALSSAGEHDRAIAMYSSLLEEQSMNPFSESGDKAELLIGLAGSNHLSGNETEAKRRLFEALSSTTDGDLRGRAFTMLGVISKKEANPELAVAYFRQAAAASPESTTTRDIADLLFESGAYHEAIRKYEQLRTADPSPDALRHYEFRLMIARMKTGALQEAQTAVAAFAKEYEDTDGEMGAYELEKGEHFYRKGDYQSAGNAFSTVLKKYGDTPSAPAAMYWAGKTLEAEGKPDDARKRYEELIGEYPGSPMALRSHFSLGNFSYRAEEWDKAVQHYRVVVENPGTDPDLMPFAMSNLIETYEAAGANDAALDLTRKYLDRFPANEDSFDKQIKIGILYQRLGYFDQSVVHLQGLLDQAGPDLEGEIRYYIAEANYEKGEYQQAILDFLKIPYLVTKKGKIDWTANSLYMAGQSYEKLGRYDQAIAMYKQIVERPGIDETFKAAARKEIDRVNLVIGGSK